MKICGIVCELNPAHNGHKYIFEKARELTGCDYLVAVMSGNYVQRGEPALLNKYVRGRMALYLGADAVLELPCQFATGSAQYFARGAVAILKGIGASHIVFGSENGDVNELMGKSFVHGDIGLPNDILAVEYINAIKYLNADIIPVAVKRAGAGYNELDINDECHCSAAAIRKLIGSDSLDNVEGVRGKLKGQMPGECLNLLLDAADKKQTVGFDGISDGLMSILIEHADAGYSKYFDVYDDLSMKIQSHLLEYKNVQDFVSILKSKDIAYSHIKRALLHIFLDITKEQISVFKEYNYAIYSRLLGFKRESAELIKYLKVQEGLQVIDKPALGLKSEAESVKNLFAQNIRADHLYYYLANKGQDNIKHEFKHPIIIM